MDLDGREVTYGSPKLQVFYENAAERNSSVRATLDAYGDGSGRDLHIGYGDPGSRDTGTANAGVFSVKMTNTATSEEQVAAWEAAGGGEAGTKAADKVWDDSFGPYEAMIVLSKRTTKRQKLHELGHADHAVKDPRGHLRSANDAEGMSDADYKKSESETVANEYARAAARKDK